MLGQARLGIVRETGGGGFCFCAPCLGQVLDLCCQCHSIAFSHTPTPTSPHSLFGPSIELHRSALLPECHNCPLVGSGAARCRVAHLPAMWHGTDLQCLCGSWTDSTRTRYWLQMDTGNSITVTTLYHSGYRRTTSGLIQIRDGTVFWGCKCQYWLSNIERCSERPTRITWSATNYTFRGRWEYVWKNEGHAFDPTAPPPPSDPELASVTASSGDTRGGEFGRLAAPAAAEGVSRPRFPPKAPPVRGLCRSPDDRCGWFNCPNCGGPGVHRWAPKLAVA